MGTPEVFAQWLDAQDGSLSERLGYAIDCWQSIEFICASKYEIVTQWLATALANINETHETHNFPTQKVRAFLSLHVQPGLIKCETKQKFINALLELGEQCTKATIMSTYREWVDIFFDLVKFDMVQDILRTDYKIFTRMYGILLRTCSSYHKQNEMAVKESYADKELFENVLNYLKDYMKGVEHLNVFAKCYYKDVRMPLCQLIIVLQSRGLKYFDKFVEFEEIIANGSKTVKSIDELYDGPLYVCLMIIKCNLSRRRHDDEYLSTLLADIFNMPLKNVAEAERTHYNLTVVHYTLDVLKEYEITLFFDVNNKPCKTFMGKCIVEIVRRYKDEHLIDVLKLLCAALRYNPLILEHEIFQVSACLLFTNKSTPNEQRLYEQYTVLLLNTFRRLGHCESLLKRLVKAIQDSLDAYIDFKPTMGITEETKEIVHYDEYSSVLIDANMPKYDACITQPYITSNWKSFSKLLCFWPSQNTGIAFSKLITSLMSKPSLTISKMLLYELKQLLEHADLSENRRKTLFMLDFLAALLCQYFSGSRLVEHMHLYKQELDVQRTLIIEVLGQFGHYVLAYQNVDSTSSRLMAAFLECCYYAAAYQHVQYYYAPDGHVNDVQSSAYSYLNDDEWETVGQRVENCDDFNCKEIFQCMQEQRKSVEFSLLHKQQTNPNQAYPLAELEGFVLNKLERIYAKLRHNDISNSCFIAIGDYMEMQGCKITLKRFLKEAGNSNTCKMKTDALYAIRDFIESCQSLPLAYLQGESKILLFFKLLALHYDLRKAASTEIALNTQLLGIIEVFIHFGQSIDIANYLSFDDIVNLLPITDCQLFYETLLIGLDKSSNNLLKDLAAWISSDVKESKVLAAVKCQLLLTTVQALTTVHGPAAKAVRTHLCALIQIYDVYVRNHFSNSDLSDANKLIASNEDFIKQTLPAYAFYLKIAMLQSGEEQSDYKANIIQVNRDFCNITKIYIGASLNYRNQHGVRLMTIALSYNKQLGITQAEIDGVLNVYWSQIMQNSEDSIENHRCAEEAIKLIIARKSDNELQDILIDLNQNVMRTAYGVELQNIVTVLSLMCKCTFSAIKAAMFNEQFKDIITKILIHLQRDDKQRIINTNFVLCLLRCFNIAIKNKAMVISTDTFDTILVCMTDFLRCLGHKDNLELFVALHSALVEVCSSIMKHRQLLLADRTPHMLSMIFKELLISVISYTDEKGKDVAISEQEVDNLGELTHKLATVADLIVANGLIFKRIAPIVLITLLNLMVSLKRPTTLYPKIKLNIHEVCHKLIKVCDSRAGPTILRETTEAGGQLYQILMKEHSKYYKFTGKI